jgi:hypothetical protein
LYSIGGPAFIPCNGAAWASGLDALRHAQFFFHVHDDIDTADQEGAELPDADGAILAFPGDPVGRRIANPSSLLFLSDVSRPVTLRVKARLGASPRVRAGLKVVVREGC